jgi:hypothetical protein
MRWTFLAPAMFIFYSVPAKCIWSYW